MSHDNSNRLFSAGWRCLIAKQRPFRARTKTKHSEDVIKKMKMKKQIKKVMR